MICFPKACTIIVFTVPGQFDRMQLPDHAYAIIGHNSLLWWDLFILQAQESRVIYLWSLDWIIQNEKGELRKTNYRMKGSLMCMDTVIVIKRQAVHNWEQITLCV